MTQAQIHFTYKLDFSMLTLKWNPQATQQINYL
jgi:hypothetical protein